MRWTISIFGTLVLLSGQPLAAQIPAQKVSFSAESALEVGDERVVGRSFLAKGRERHELSIDGLSQVTILRPDLDRAYVVQEGIEALIELPIEEVAILPPLISLHTYDATEEGRETVLGEETTRYHLSNPKGDLGPPELTVWITDDGVVVQMRSEVELEGERETVLQTYSNVVRGDQDPALFDPRNREALEAGPDPLDELPDDWGIKGP